MRYIRDYKIYHILRHGNLLKSIIEIYVEGTIEWIKPRMEYIPTFSKDMRIKSSRE